MNKTAMMNQRVWDLLNTPGGTEKVAQAGQTWIKDRVYEEAACTHIIEMENKSYTDSDVQVSLHQDEVYVVVPVEPESAAMSVNFRGEHDASLIRAPRMAAGMFSITSRVYDMYDENMGVYQKLNQPITKIIEKKIPLDLQTILDRTFVTHIESAVQAMQTEANGGSAAGLYCGASSTIGSTVEYSIYKGANARAVTTGAVSATPLPLARADFGTLRNIMVAKQLRATVMLISDYDWNAQMALTHEDLGTTLTGETYEKGFTMQTLGGFKVVKTIKTNILRPGNVYAFTDQDYLGRMYSMGDVKFYIEKIANKTTFQGRWQVGMAIVNVNAVAKIELYSADANPSTDADSLLTDLTVKDEDDLWDVNNRVDDGVYYPAATVY